MQNWLGRIEKYVVFVVVLAGLLALVLWYHGEQVLVSQEAAVRSWVGIDLLAGAVKGRQGLVGSLKWEPLPTLMLLPLVRIPGLGASGLAAAVVNAVIAAFTLTLLNNWWARFGMPRPVRFPLLVLFVMSPPVLASVLTGSSSTLMLLILMAWAHFLVNWMRTLDVRSLAYLGVLGGLAIITFYPSVVLVAAMIVLVLSRVVGVRKRSFRSATLLVYLIPSLYTAGLWFVGNWLIMGQPLFFLRGIATRERFLAEVREMQLDWYLYLMALLLLVAAAVAGKVTPKAAKKALTVSLATLLLFAVFAWPYVTEYVLEERYPSYFGRNEKQLERIDEIVHHLERKHPDAKVFVCGYTGYQFIARSPNKERFVHLVSLDLRKIERETRGQELFFLVPKPRGVYRWEDVNLRLGGLFERYLDLTVVDEDVRFEFMLDRPGDEWPDWHLIRVIRADKSDE